MFVVNDKPGQLANQLWASAPLIARALKYKRKYLNLYFGDNSHYFENLNCYKNIKFNCFKSPFLDLYLRKTLLKLAMNAPDWLLKTMRIYADKVNWKRETWEESVLENKRGILITGSGYRRNNRILLGQYHDELKNIFQPKTVFTSRIRELFNKQWEHHNVIIGVHIRRGDYKEFLNGAYYFDDLTYLNYLRSLREQFVNHGQNPVFLLASNEELNVDYFSEIDTFQLEEPSAIEDLYALSCCDFILGPPSTFSMWSSYIGKVPLRFIKHKNENIRLSEFSRIVEQDVFENNTILEHIAFDD